MLPEVRSVSLAGTGKGANTVVAAVTFAAMRIGYVFSRPLPSPDADTLQVLKMVDALAGEGADVELIVSRTGVARRGGELAFAEELQAFYALRRPPRIAMVPGPAPTRLGAERPWHSLAASVAARRRYDVVYSRNRSAAVFAALSGTPALFETYRRLGDESPAFVRLLARLARRGSLVGVIAHSRTAAASIAGRGFPEARLVAIHNGHDPEDLLPRLSRREARAALGLPLERPLCCYAGGLGPGKGIEALFELAALTPGIAYLLAGGPAHDAARARRECTRRGLANIEVLDFRPIAELGACLYAADVLLVPPSGALARSGRTVLPLKLFTYLAAGRPILAPATHDVCELLAHGENAWLTPPDDPYAAAVAVLRLVEDRALGERLAHGALARAQGLTWRARARKLLDQIEAWR